MAQRKVSQLAILTETGSLADKLTDVDVLADVGVVDAGLLKTKHFQFDAAANTLVVKILGSLDDGVTFPLEVAAEFDVAVGSSVTKSITTYYTNLKVQVKPKVGGSHGTLSTKYAGASF